MLLRSLVAIALAAVPVPAAPQEATPASPLPLVICPKLQGSMRGSAFRVGAHLLLTAKHVTAEAPCSIEGDAMHVTYKGPDSDYAMLSDDRTGAFFKVDCGGFVEGKEYVALGHARGLDQITAVPLTATGEYHDNGDAILVGIMTAIPGQSGGPIVDPDTGKAVGIVSASNFEHGLSFAGEVKDTPVCKTAA
jgi:hypothetical protein